MRPSNGYIRPGLKSPSKVINPQFGGGGGLMMQSNVNVKSAIHQSPMRPYYPPNYVSKAHLLKSMDRKEFVKMMLMEEEREKLKMNIEQKVDEIPAGTTSTTESVTESLNRIVSVSTTPPPPSLVMEVTTTSDMDSATTTGPAVNTDLSITTTATSLLIQ